MANNKIAYGLAKKYGIDTTGMTPKEVWDALKEKGISQADSSKKSKEIKDLQSKSSDELKEIATVDITQKHENENNSDFNSPFAGGVLDKKEYVEEYYFTGSKWDNEEADVYYLKDGTKIIFQSMGDPRYQKITPQQAIRVWNKIPNYLKRFAPNEIEFVDYYNPDDIFWQSAYSDFKHSYATSGAKITFYRNNESLNTDNQIFRAICHEIGHSIDNRLEQTTKYKQEWENIILQDGGKRVTEYAKNHIREDFAESVALYVDNPTQFEKDFPNRFIFLEKWVKNSIF